MRKVKVVSGRRLTFRIEDDLDAAVQIMCRKFGKTEQQLIEGVLRRVLLLEDRMATWTDKALGRL